MCVRACVHVCRPGHRAQYSILYCGMVSALWWTVAHEKSRQGGTVHKCVKSSVLHHPPLTYMEMCYLAVCVHYFRLMTNPCCSSECVRVCVLVWGCNLPHYFSYSLVCLQWLKQTNSRPPFGLYGSSHGLRFSADKVEKIRSRIISVSVKFITVGAGFM